MSSNHGANHHHHEHPDHERIDQQQIQAQRLLALRVIPLKSRLGKLITERFEELYEKLGDQIDPAKRRSLTVANQDRTVGNEADLSRAKSQDLVIGGPTAVPGAEQVLVTDGPGFQSRAVTVDSQALSAPLPQFREEQAPQQQQRRQPDAAVQIGQSSWVWMLSQLLQTDLKRLGLEPDELDDIRVFLIKSEAAKFDKLELLSKLPDSLSPEAVTKIFEDIRTMAAGYVAFVMVERAKSEVESGEGVKQLPELPRSIVNPFHGIQTFEFDPEEILRKLG
jgi:hypothetical protein